MIDTEDFCPLDNKDWRKWLELNHKKKDAVWLIFYKKGSPHYNLNWTEAVDDTPCFDWIVSTKRTIIKDKYMQYFSKRKAKSNWSRINKEKVNALIGNGLMKEEGFKSIEIAKENGSRAILDEVEALVIPEDLEAELFQYKNSLQYFESLSKSDKKILLY